MSKLLIFFSLLLGSFSLKAQGSSTDPFDWLSEIDTTDLDDNALPDFDWSTWQKEDWEEAFRNEYEQYYQSKESKKTLFQAYQLAQEQGVNMPQRYDSYTYDPEQETLDFESDADYHQRLDNWANRLDDELTETGMDVALDVLYKELEPVLKTLKKKNSVLLDKILPQGSGMPVWDPLEDFMKEKQEGKQNFKYWVKLAAENVMQNLFKKNAKGKYELQRENIELLKQVGIVRFLKISVMDWELTQSLALEVPDEVLSYAHALQQLYQSGQTTLQTGKALYQQINMLDTELLVPAQYDQFNDVSETLKIHRLTLIEMANKRKKLLALTYRELARRYQEYGEELNSQLNGNDQLKMNDAERVKSLQIANDYIQQSLHLQARAEQLLSKSDKYSISMVKDQYVERQTHFKRLEAYY